MITVPMAARLYMARNWSPVPAPGGQKGPNASGWQDRNWRVADFGEENNIGIILGIRSGGLTDVDLDCSESVALASLYLPATEAIFGRKNKPKSHWLYITAAARKEAFSDPLTGEMMVELRAAGRDGAAHQTIFPPSRHPTGELIEWYIDRSPQCVLTNSLRTAVAWLAIGCLVARHVSMHAALRPGADLPDLLYESDPTLGRAAYKWLDLPDPDAPKYSPKPRSELSATEVTLWGLADAIPNNNENWDDWNAFGLAFFAASGGSDEGFIAFDRFSAKSSKYLGAETSARWRHFGKSPPSNTGIGKLIAAAIKAGWRSERRNASA